MTQLIIIDDEANARSILRDFLTSYCPNVEILGEADGVMSGLKLIRQKKPDAVLLDIQMKDGTGFDLLDKFKNPGFQVIFTTAFDEFAIKAFKYNAIDYLLKPINIDELIAAVDKIDARKNGDLPSEQIGGLKEAMKTGQLNRLVLSSSEGLHFVELSEIIRLKSEGNYTTFFLTSKEKIVVSKSIKAFSEILPNTFFRTHQSHIVHLNFVKKFLREDGGYALTEDNSKVPISRSKKDEFLNLFTK